MKGKHLFTILIAVIAAIAVLSFIAWYIMKPVPDIIQGEMVAKTVKVSSKLTGRIDSMLVEEGQQVRRGQLLYVISTPEVDAKLQQAEAARSAAYYQERIAYEGARVQEVQAAYNLWQSAVAASTLAQQTFDRMNNLYQAGVVPAQKYDEAEAALKATRSSEQAAKAQYDLVVAGARTETQMSARALVDQATGAVNEVEAYKADSHLYSPIDGEVSSVIAEQNELVSAGYPAVSLIDMNDMWASFNIKETYLPKIRKDMGFMAYIPALDRHVKMQVTYIAVQADFATWAATRTTGEFDIRTFEVRAKAVERVPELRPGMSVVFDWNEL